ncbi:unnamed protein product, partial [Allacma fusca]
FSKLIHEKFDHVDVLINNAGIYKFDGKIRRTNDGFEEHMGVNHLNPFLLTLLLLDLLAKSERSRIVCVASTISLLQEFNVNDLNMENFKKFGIYAPYSNSKMANILFMRELARRLGENSNINCYAICPGMVNIERAEDQAFFKRFFFNLSKCWGFLDLENGCLNTLHCTLSKSLDHESGKMYRFLDVWDIDKKLDVSLAEQLFDKSEELVGQKFQKP